MELGIKPDRLGVHLVTGSDFNCVLTLQDATGATSWPAGTTLQLVFANGVSPWSATISASQATFAVDKATSDQVADKTAVSLVYTNGSTDQTWAQGVVIRHG